MPITWKENVKKKQNKNKWQFWWLSSVKQMSWSFLPMTFFLVFMSFFGSDILKVCVCIHVLAYVCVFRIVQSRSCKKCHELYVGTSITAVSWSTMCSPAAPVLPLNCCMTSQTMRLLEVSLAVAFDPPPPWYRTSFVFDHQSRKVWLWEAEAQEQMFCCPDL